MAATNKSLADDMQKKMLDTSREKAFHQELRDAPKVKLYLSPSYRPYFGKRMAVVLNGVPIYFPVDGMTYSVPEPYAAIIHARRRAVDDFLMRKQKLSAVQTNLENYAGELTF